ncbi:hypothetical protein [Cyclobacterium amurskyense]|uniref:Uncharacterized protein n=1 Tax=Cyclobacterium amurskyense TaxID=320787 RepID=A0A0H4P893_9BACT|nr:hypothetical protein [Cyclobacterium amurskyense]AKP50676.1 hypothetical protein CA2015_1228 [Cyclobacterium amurskyense]
MDSKEQKKENKTRQRLNFFSLWAFHIANEPWLQDAIETLLLAKDSFNPDYVIGFLRPDNSQG